MPVPFLPKFGGHRYAIGFEALRERPKLAAALGECIGVWSYVDNEIGGLFGILLGTSSPAAHRVFVTLRRWANQQECLSAAAEGTLSATEMSLYRGLITEYKGLESERNELAHGCFGICPDDEALLFVINVRHHVLWQADIIPKHLQGIMPPDSHEGLKKEMKVYTLTELETLHSRMEQLWWDLFYFNGYLREPQNDRRGEEFRVVFDRVCGKPVPRR
jgi:hypothetical protein